MEIILIIFGLLLILIIFRKTEVYDSRFGFFMVSLFITLALLKIYKLPSLPNLYLPENFLKAGQTVFIFTLTMIFIGYRLREKKEKFNWKYFLSLFLLYLPFSLMQQLLFQYLFLDTLFSLTHRSFFSVLLTGIYFYYFHHQRFYSRFSFFIFTISFFWSYVYLVYGNIIWLVLSHSILGSCYYIWFRKDNILRNRLKLINENEWL